MCASCIWIEAVTHGKKSITTRRILKVSPLTWDFILLSTVCSSFLPDDFGFFCSIFYCLQIWCRRGRSLLLFVRCVSVSGSSFSMTENTRVSLRALSSCSPLPAVSHFSSQRWPCFLFDSVVTAPRSIISFLALRFRHLILRSIYILTDAFNLK